ncbi:MAG: MFS transporter, partial [Alcanivorax sp.]|nr:MFS transporter [Alcanivorax sp.]
MTETKNNPLPENKPKGLLINLLFNIIIPTLILTKLSGTQHLGVHNALIIALAFPISYGLHGFV